MSDSLDVATDWYDDDAGAAGGDAGGSGGDGCAWLRAGAPSQGGAGGVPSATPDPDPAVCSEEASRVSTELGSGGADASVEVVVSSVEPGPSPTTAFFLDALAIALLGFGLWRLVVATLGPRGEDDA